MGADPSRVIRLLREAAADPLADTALSRVVLDDVSTGDVPESLRLYRPRPHVAFGRQDAVSEGYAEAVAAARERGYEAVERLAGGRAAVFHEETIALAWAVPDPEPRDHIRERFRVVAEIVVAALGRTGVDARVGEIPGEYCPGEFSVNAGGRRKIMGVGQRIVRNAAHVGGVVVVSGADRVRDVLLPVYQAMGFPWRPETTGDVAAEAPGTTFEVVIEAIVEEFARRFALEPAEFDAGTLTRAEARAGEYSPRT